MTAIASSLIGTVSTETLTTPLVSILSMPLANTEYSFTFPAGTKEYALQNRANGLVKYKTVSLGDYWTLFPGQPYYINNIKGSATVTVYFESPKIAQTIEILSWS